MRQKKYADKHGRPAPEYERGSLVLLETQVLKQRRSDDPFQIPHSISAANF